MHRRYMAIALLIIMRLLSTGLAVGPKFVEVSRSAGVWRAGIGWGLSFADFDQDGDMDLLMPYHDLADPFLYANVGDGTFENASACIPERPYADHHVWRWADLDNDGYPELTAGIGSTGGHSFNYFEIFQNDQHGGFVDITDQVKLGDKKTRGRQIAWFDADNDGLLDALLTAHLPQKTEPKYQGFRGVQFYRNMGGMAFKDMTDHSGVHHDGHSNWCAPGDFDGDGDIDLFIEHHGERPFFFENLGNCEFKNITDGQPFENLDKIFDADWVDYDSDGDLDLYITQGGSGRNTVSEGYQVTANEVTFYFQRDGSKDLADEIVINTAANRLDLRGCEEFHEVIFGRRLFRPTAEQYLIGKELRPADALPLEIKRRADGENAGLFFTPDIPTDGGPRIYIWRPENEPAWHLRFVRGEDRQGREYSARIIFEKAIDFVRLPDCELVIRENYLYENRNGKFVDVTQETGVGDDENSGDAIWQDFDNDGDIDLMLARYSYSFHGAAPLVLYDNIGDGKFMKTEKGLGLERQVIQSRTGLSCADYDNDGYLDLALSPGLSNPPFRFGESMLFKSMGGGNHWLKIKLKGTKSNADAIGAWVTLHANGKKQTRYHIAGQSVHGQDTPLVHFGLGDCDKIDELTIVWPSGKTQTITKVTADQTLLVVEQSL